jgi:signal transduction histidine kinase
MDEERLEYFAAGKHPTKARTITSQNSALKNKILCLSAVELSNYFVVTEWNYRSQTRFIHCVQVKVGTNFMDLMSGIWLGSGVGLGVLTSWLWNRKPTSPVCETNGETSCETRLKELELAYRSAIEMGQFKAGFLARISHEIRSPLNGLIGTHQLILADLCESPEEEREFIAQANESALKMVTLLDEVIHVAKAEYGAKSINLEPLSLTSIFENVYSLTHLLAENRNLKFHVALPEPDIYVLADRRSLEQALVSLIDGAIATMQEGNLSLSVHSSEQFAHIQLEDERSIDAWREEFDRLQKTPNPPTSLDQKSSLGFSLLLSQALIEVMNGKLEIVMVPSSPGETVTRLQCKLPRITLE